MPTEADAVNHRNCGRSSVTIFVLSAPVLLKEAPNHAAGEVPLASGRIVFPETWEKIIALQLRMKDF